jgi:hypothetical protein
VTRRAGRSGVPAERLAGTVVELGGHRRQLVWAMHAQVGALWEGPRPANETLRELAPLLAEEGIGDRGDVMSTEVCSVCAD